MYAMYDLDLLLPYQKQWRLDANPRTICVKARSIGMTYTEAGDCVQRAGLAHGGDCWYVPANKEMAMAFLEQCAAWAKSLGMEHTEITDMACEVEGQFALSMMFMSGFWITALSGGAALAKFAQFTDNAAPLPLRCTFDEAAFQVDFHAVYAQALTHCEQIHVMSTVDHVSTAFHALVKAAWEDDSQGSVHVITHATAVHEGLYRLVCELANLEWSSAAQDTYVADVRRAYAKTAAQELDCVPRDSLR